MTITNKTWKVAGFVLFGIMGFNIGLAGISAVQDFGMFCLLMLTAIAIGVVARLEGYYEGRDERK